MFGVRYVVLQGGCVCSITPYARKKWDGSMMEAICFKEHPAPQEWCQCGYYAFDTVENIDGTVGWVAKLGVIILVEAFGRVVLHEKGFRSEYMLPKYVVYPMEVSEKQVQFFPTGFSIPIADLVHYRNVQITKDHSEQASKLLNVPIITPDEAKLILQ